MHNGHQSKYDSVLKNQRWNDIGMEKKKKGD